MKKVLSIIFLAALHLGACAFLYYLYFITYGLIVMQIGEPAALEVAKSTDVQLLYWTLAVLAVLSIIGFYVLKKGLMMKRSGMVTAMLALLVVGSSLPGFLNARHNFLEYQRSKITFNDIHSLAHVSSIEVKLSSQDSIINANENSLLEDIKAATHQRGIWKFAKTHQIIIHQPNHIDTLYTNGSMMTFRNQFFEAKEDLKEKYGW